MNAIIITGRLTKDPELATTKNGLPACRFTLAVSVWHKGEDGNNATFVDCSALGKQAEFISKYCHKGDVIGVSGKLDCYTWKDKEDKKHKEFFINIGTVETILRKDRSGKETTEAPTSNAPTQARENRVKREEPKIADDLSDDDMPF